MQLVEFAGENYDALALFIALVALAISFFNFLRQQGNQRFIGTQTFNSSWQSFNQVLVGDDQFIEFESQFHPFGKLTHDEVKKLYYYFMRFNVAYAAFQGRDHFHRKLASSSLRNEANLTFRDRNFIREHVFGRGYDKGFSDQFEENWKLIEDSGKTLSMDGDVDGKYVVDLID